jgi:O-acetyl-ADP-ribose deacetylase (regulator of RNase III)
MKGKMTPITYLIGDATQPRGDGPKIIVHVCNDIGAWGAGFVIALSRRWPQPEAAYRSLAARPLGLVQFVKVSPGITVANMVAQHGIGRGRDGSIPLRYDALADCLAKVTEQALSSGASVHMPRIGCGLAGGEWSKVETIIESTLCAFDVPVFVYDLSPRT